MFPFHNKAQAEFNWILILIAGTILLIALIAFAIDYRSLSNKKLNTELSLALSSHLDTLTTSGLSTSLNPDGMDFSRQVVWKKQTVRDPAPEFFATFLRMR